VRPINGVTLEGEYEQLADLVDIAYWEDNQLADDLQAAARPLWPDCKDSHHALMEWVAYLRREAHRAANRREEIIFWLYTDTQLRHHQGRSYPDVVESPLCIEPCPDDEF